MTAELEDHYILFVDFLGFGEASVQMNAATQSSILQLLHSIASMRSDFYYNERKDGGGSAISARPAVTTFSDHIVASFPASKLTMGSEDLNFFLVINHVTNLLWKISAAALPLGLLIRGSFTRGKLYHAGGVVFGPAMVEAFQLESRAATYPRVVLSRALSERYEQFEVSLTRDNDGLISIDYLPHMVLNSVPFDEHRFTAMKAWFENVAAVIKNNIENLDRDDQLIARSKWIWFSKNLKDAMNRRRQLFVNSPIDSDLLDQLLPL